MCALTKRTTIYLDPAMHRALQHKALETSRSVSDLVNDAVRNTLAEDAEDLAAFEERVNEPLLTYESVLKQLKNDGRL
ncbi:ribbon-helix-helix protein, CopG family [Geomonas anaerohicana]|uniref:Ribbon-helix-helix protein, CopG family n=1 Tax=Geomonas anaerohicana TaxID=2798583 RepID=A0ABS0YCK1_9BACT|nr:ribbon-helix-helix protein, CopG family [Geomonas anaerohicana]MBJ6749644.1 ribbon-helix-helix protein, CopG family [Geomonas anaerohicana]